MNCDPLIEPLELHSTLKNVDMNNNRQPPNRQHQKRSTKSPTSLPWLLYCARGVSLVVKKDAEDAISVVARPARDAQTAATSVESVSARLTGKRLLEV